MSADRPEALPGVGAARPRLSTTLTAPPAVLALFALSGATGLVYEVLWMRALGLIFGHTVYAITTVLVSFMLGLSLGSAVLGRLAPLVGHPLRAYAALEAGIGLSALGVPWAIEAVGPMALRLVPGNPEPGLLGFVQFALILPVLVLPTALMGGTLPILIRLTGEGVEGLGVRAGSLYAANTLGAVAGVAGAGFLLLPALGNRGSGMLAAGANLVVGAAAWGLSRSVPAPGIGERSPPPRRTAGEPSPSRGLAWGCLAMSGALAMIGETAWARALGLVIGSSTYAFTAMLLAFLLGIGLGSAAYTARAPRASLGVLAGLQLGAAAAGTLALLAFRRLPDLFLSGFALSDSPGAVQALQVALCVLILLPVSCAFGATFPAAVALAARPGDHAAGAVGSPYALNTLGAIAGTMAAGFIMIPALGVEGTLRAAAAGSAGLAVILVAGGLRRPRDAREPAWEPLPRSLAPTGPAGHPWGAAGLAVAVGLAAVTVPGWDRRVLTSGVAIYGNTYLATPGGLHATLDDERVLFYRDGVGATVSVHENARGRFLRINGKTDASTGDMHTQLMLGHLPLLLYPGARDVLVIGLGSGVTAGAVLQHGVRRVDVVEIEPAVVEAARFFTRENRGALDDPRTRLRIADARQLLMATPARYDVIISEPSNPWIGGVATLFTEEFFALARSRLKPGGLMVQWVHGYGLAPADLRMVVRTFRTNFPAATLWGPTAADYLLVGAPGPLALDVAAIGRRVAAAPGVRDALESIGFAAPEALLADFLLGEADLARYAAAGALNTDDRLPLEFSAPRSLYRDTTLENRRAILAGRRAEFPPMVGNAIDPNTPPARRAIAVALLRRGQHEEALLHLDEALARDPGYLPARVERAKAYLVLGLTREGEGELKGTLVRDPGQAEAALALSLLYVSRGDLARATRYAQQAVLAVPTHSRYRSHLAGLYLRSGDFARAEAEYRGALALAPDDAALREGLHQAVVRGRGAHARPER